MTSSDVATDIPFRMLPTTRLAADTHLVRQVFGEGAMPEVVQLNSMVITGAEPVIVDTGALLTLEPWSEAVFSLVDPEDVRWVFLSHDDPDHVGAVPFLLERCPQATFVANAFMAERMMGEVPMDRMRWVNHGESWSAGDRELVAFLPPVFDGPTTRGLFDPTTGVYWAADAFGAMLPAVADSAAEVDADLFAAKFLELQQLIAPWHQWLDEQRFNAHVTALRDLNPRSIANCHGVPLTGPSVATGFELLRRLPSAPVLELPGNDVLAMVLAGFEQAVAA